MSNRNSPARKAMLQARRAWRQVREAELLKFRQAQAAAEAEAYEESLAAHKKLVAKAKRAKKPLPNLPRKPMSKQLLPVKLLGVGSDCFYDRKSRVLTASYRTAYRQALKQERSHAP